MEAIPIIASVKYYPEQAYSREEFLRVIPLYIVGKSTDFPLETENEILLFVTLKDLDSFYFISNLNRGINTI